MGESKAFQALLLVASATIGAASTLLIAGSAHVVAPRALAAAFLVSFTAYVSVGLMLARRPRQRVIGLLLTSIGLAGALRVMSAADSAVLYSVGTLGSHAMPVLLVHLLMVFPSGRLESRFQRLVVALGYLDAVVLAIPSLLVFDPRLNCSSCPGNAFAITSNDGLFQPIAVVRLTVDAFVAAGLVTALTNRWYSSVPSQRVVLAPVISSGVLTLAVFFIAFVSEASGASSHVLGALDVIVLAVATTVPAAIAFGLVRGRFSRANVVGDLVATLTDKRIEARDLQAILAGAVGDPTLQLAFWLPESRSFVDISGAAIETPGPNSNRRYHSVDLGGEMVAAIFFDSSIDDQSELIRTVGGAAALSLENNRLEAELRAKLAELRDSRARIVEAAESERKRIERNLHDGAQQQLIAIALKLQLATSRLEADPESAKKQFRSAAFDLTSATEELRELARGIHPAIVTDQGLEAALVALADRSPIRVDVLALPGHSLEEHVESAAYFVVSEALANIARHSGADRAGISVRETGDLIEIVVSDNGVGGARIEDGTGLRGLADRVAAMDGSLSIESPDGKGTRLRAVIRRDLSSTESHGPSVSDHGSSVDTTLELTE